MSDVLLCVSSSHKNAPFSLLEGLSGAADAARTLTSRNEFFSGAVVVATCNRFEAYLDVRQPEGSDPRLAVVAAWQAVCAHTGVEYEDLKTGSAVYVGDAAAQHLFSVTAGLESLVVGETEISGQVANALEHARKIGTTTSDLERLFQTAAKTSRDVKNQTKLGRMGRSIVQLALDLSDSRIVDWSRLRVLLVGTGQYARVTVAALKTRGVTDIAVHSASGRAEHFAEMRELRAVKPERLTHELACADLIVTCTTSPHTVIDAALLRASRTEAAHTGVSRAAVEATGSDADAPGCPFDHGSVGSVAAVPNLPARQLVIDLGMPRNVAVDVTDLPEVELLDLETIKLHAPLSELRSSDDARSLVDEAAQSFHQQRNQQRVGRGLAQLKAMFFDKLDAEIERSRRHEPSQANTEKALHHLVGVLLNTSMQRSRELAAEDRPHDFVDALEALYGIQVDMPDEDAETCGRCPIAHELLGPHTHRADDDGSLRSVS